MNASNDIDNVSLSDTNSNISITKDAQLVVIKEVTTEIKTPESHNYIEEMENSQEIISKRVCIIKQQNNI